MEVVPGHCNVFCSKEAKDTGEAFLRDFGKHLSTWQFLLSSTSHLIHMLAMFQAAGYQKNHMTVKG